MNCNNMCSVCCIVHFYPRHILCRLESLCGRADTLCSTLGQECEEVTKRDAHRVKDLQGLEKETVALRSEIATLLNQYKVRSIVLILD